MNFRLTYDGPLKAASQSETRRVEKHAMRQVFSRQLTELISTKDHVFLPEINNLPKSANNTPDYISLGKHMDKLLFVGLVREKLHLVCDLDILFLRRDDPGRLISGGGDLDNRIKVLFDALRIPQDENEIRGLMPDKPEVVYCLTEDDKLITGFRVTTDRLLEPAQSESDINNVRLIINVEIKATQMTTENMAYFAHF